MTALETLETKLPTKDYMQQLGGSLTFEIISAMREYAKIKCQEQRAICTEHTFIRSETRSGAMNQLVKNEHGETELFSVDTYSILNAPEPKFD